MTELQLGVVPPTPNVEARKDGSGGGSITFRAECKGKHATDHVAVFHVKLLELELTKEVAAV